MREIFTKLKNEIEYTVETEKQGAFGVENGIIKKKEKYKNKKHVSPSICILNYSICLFKFIP